MARDPSVLFKIDYFGAARDGILKMAESPDLISIGEGAPAGNASEDSIHYLTLTEPQSHAQMHSGNVVSKQGDLSNPLHLCCCKQRHACRNCQGVWWLGVMVTPGCTRPVERERERERDVVSVMSPCTDRTGAIGMC